jgi:hypothetical protein
VIISAEYQSTLKSKYKKRRMARDWADKEYWNDLIQFWDRLQKKIEKKIAKEEQQG